MAHMSLIRRKTVFGVIKQVDTQVHTVSEATSTCSLNLHVHVAMCLKIVNVIHVPYQKLKGRSEY